MRRGASTFCPERLIQARTAAGLSAREAAAKANIRTAVLEQYESGERTPNAQMVASLAATVGCSSKFLLDATDEPTLLDLREQAGLTQKAGAAAAQLARGALAMLEAGRTRDLKHAVAEDLATAYGTTTEEVLDAHRRSVEAARPSAPIWLNERTLQRLAEHLDQDPEQLRALIESIQDEERRNEQ